MPELTVHTEETELPGGRVLRVSRVERPRGSGESIVVERLVDSSAARSLMEPSDGDRLTLDADALSDLMELLEEVTARD